MQYQEFVNRVNTRIQEQTPGETEFAIQATFATVGECVSGKEAESLSSQLPVELALQLESGNYANEAKRFSLAEFYRRIADREGTLHIEDACMRARMVITELLEVITNEELTSMKLKLPEGFESLFNVSVSEVELNGRTSSS